MLDNDVSTFSGAVLRTLVLPVDVISLGLVPLLFIGITRKKQNLGDLLTGSIVVNGRERSRVAFLATGAILALMALIAVFPSIARNFLSRP